MVNRVFELGFEASSERPRPPKSWVEVSVDGVQRTDGGGIKVTMNCAGYDELSVQIEALKEELDAIKMKAKRRFSEHKKKFKMIKSGEVPE